MKRFVFIACALPLLIIVVGRIAIPDPSRPRASFPSKVFAPSQVTMKEKKGSRGSDYFELWLYDPVGGEYFFRDPEREPIRDLYRRIPQDQPLKILYSPTWEGNVLLEISLENSAAPPPLPFGAVMGEYASRRRVIAIVAGVWFVVWITLGGLVALSLRRMERGELVAESEEDGI